MSKYVIVSDATLDLPYDIIQKHDIHVIPMVFDVDEMTYTHYPDERELSIEDFYGKIKAGSVSKSSQITPHTYQEFLGTILEQGYDVLYICFTSGLSGTFNSAKLAFEMLQEDYPERKLICIDSLCASIGEGVLVLNAALKKEEGYSIDELADWVTNHRHNARHWFTVKDLFHLKRGGRVSGIEALVGTALKIHPVLSVDEQGKLTVISKVRGSKKVLEFLFNKLVEEGIDTKEQTIIVAHGDSLEQAEQLADMIRNAGLVKEIIISKIGPIIGTHTGPGMLALTFLGRSE